MLLEIGFENTRRRSIIPFLLGQHVFSFGLNARELMHG